MLLDQMLLDESVQNVTEPTTCTSKEHLEIWTNKILKNIQEIL